MFANPRLACALALCCVVTMAAAQPADLAELQLPNPVSWLDLTKALRKMEEAGCKTKVCEGFSVAVGVLQDGERYFGSPGTVGTGPNGERESWQSQYSWGGRTLDAVLARHRKVWPEICAAVRVIAERYSPFLIPGRPQWPEGDIDDTYGPHMSSSIDIAHRLTRPGLDCLGQVMQVVRPTSKNSAEISHAYVLCRAQHGRARCARLWQPPNRWLEATVVDPRPRNYRPQWSSKLVCGLPSRCD